MSSLQFDEIIKEIRTKLVANDIEGALELIEHLHPADRADVVTELKPENQILVLTNLDPSESADVLEEMEDEDAASFAEMVPPQDLAVILDEMESDEVVDVLGVLSPEYSALALDKMEDFTRERAKSLLKYPDDTAGGLMTTAILTLREDWTVHRTLIELRRIGPQTDSLYYLFVTDENEHLLGVLALRTLVAHVEETIVGRIMESDVISVNVMTDQEECAVILRKYGFLALPVVDDSGRLLGVITADDLIEVAEDEATEDMLRLAGIIADGEERVFGPTRLSIVKRLPWLAINIITLMIAVSVIDIFEDLIAGLVILAVFLPIVSGEGGNAGSQTVTVIIRGLAIGEISVSDARQALIKESLVTIVNGAIIGLGTAVVAYVWKGNLIVALAIFLAMVLNFLVAALSGVLIPLGLKKLNIDPALASAAFVTGFTDTFGFLFFLGIVTLLS